MRGGFGLKSLVGLALWLLTQAACAPLASVTPSAAAPTSTGPDATASLTPTPHASVGVFEGPPDAYLPAIAACLREAGWNVTVGADGSISAGFTPEQREAFIAAEAACEATVGAPPPFPTASDAEIRAVYEYWAGALRDCLIDLGYAISDPPSIDQFIDSYPTGPWSPYSDLPAMGPAEWEHVNTVCPQIPER